MTFKRAFSLIELSIVLVIIGLLSASIVGSQKLVAQAKVKKVINEVKEIQDAIRVFYSTYNAYPGDIKDATSYWTSGTANGDGDKIIEHAVGTAGAGVSESGRAFQHLSLAGLVKGSYTAAAVLKDSPTIAYNSSISPKASYILTNFCLISSNSGNLTNLNHCGGSTASTIRLGSSESPESHTNTAVGYGVLSVEQASFIDRKIDDGLPRRGFVYSHNEYRYVSSSDDSRKEPECLRFEDGSGDPVDTASSPDKAFYNYGTDFKCNMSFDIEVMNQ